MSSKIWTVRWDQRAVKDLKALSKESRQRILNYIEQKIDQKSNLNDFGQSLTGNKAGLWRYRVSDCRIICNFSDAELIILIIAVGHRKEIYK